MDPKLRESGSHVCLTAWTTGCADKVRLTCKHVVLLIRYKTTLHMKAFEYAVTLSCMEYEIREKHLGHAS